MSSYLKQLFHDGTMLNGIWETIYLTLVSTVFAYAIGIVIGIVLCITDRDGIKPIFWLNKIISIIVNIFRSIPFIIMMVAFLPFAKFIVGRSYGPEAMIVMLIIAAAPYVARMVESSLKEVDKGVIEAARSMGAGTFKIIWKVYLPEAKPSLIVGAVISTVTVLGYSAMAATINGGGLGQIAIFYGYNNFKDDVIWMCVLFTVIIVQVIQEVGMFIARKTDRRISKSKKFKKHLKEKI